MFFNWKHYRETLKGKIINAEDAREVIKDFKNEFEDKNDFMDFCAFCWNCVNDIKKIIRKKKCKKI